MMSDGFLTIAVIGLIIGIIGAPASAIAAFSMAKRSYVGGVFIWALIAALSGIAIGSNATLIISNYHLWGL